MKKLFVVDAMAMAFRTFYAIGPGLTTPSGKPVAAVYGAAMFVSKLLEMERPDYLVVASDSQAKTFRHDMFAGYKANRPPMPPDLAAQMDDFYRLFAAFGIPVLKERGLEADDFIGSLARKFASDEVHIYIVGGDKDFMQLVSANVSLYLPRKGEDASVIDPAGVREKLGCDPSQLIDLLALTGDSSDNVPGVDGVGDKTAAKLISTYGSLDGVYANLDSISGKKMKERLSYGRESALLSRALVTIKTDHPLAVDLDDLRTDVDEMLGGERTLAFYREMAFRSLIERALKRRSVGAASGTKSALGLIASPDGAAAERAAASESVAVQATLRDGYQIVDSREKMEAMVATLAASPAVAVDIELVDGVYPFALPLAVALSGGEGIAFMIPMDSERFSDVIASSDAVASVACVLSRAPLVVAHDVKAKLHALHAIGIEIRSPVADVMLMDYLLDPDHRNHDLDDCAMRRLAHARTPREAHIGSRKGKKRVVPSDTSLAAYVCEGADLTLRLHEVLSRRIAEASAASQSRHGTSFVLNEIEIPTIPVLVAMERAGTFVDAEALGALSVRIGGEIERIEGEIHALAGESFNIASPKQLQKILFGKMRVHEQLGAKRLKKGRDGFSTDESNLSKLAKAPIAKLVLEFRSLSKIRSTYADRLPACVNRATGRIHGHLNQAVTATGRLSSSEPNLQNIPVRSELGQEIRKAFRSQSEEAEITSADYSQIELRLLAHLSGDDILIEAFRNGYDIHRATAAKVLGIAPEEVSPELRSRAKAINFGIIYGMGAKRLAEGTDLSVAEAAAFIEKYFGTYPSIRAYIEGSIQSARERGYTETMFGRRRYVTELDSKSEAEAASARNIAVNSPIQGSAADIMKIAMARVRHELQARGLKTRLLLQVHDELVLEGPKSERESLHALLKEVMESAVKLLVPLVAEVRSAGNWQEAH